MDDCHFLHFGYWFSFSPIWFLIHLLGSLKTFECAKNIENNISLLSIRIEVDLLGLGYLYYYLKKKLNIEIIVNEGGTGMEMSHYKPDPFRLSF